MDMANSAATGEGGTMSEKSIARQQAPFIRWAKVRSRGPAESGCGSRLVVSNTGEAYDALESDPNRES